MLLQQDHDRIQTKAALETDKALSKEGQKINRDDLIWQDVYANKSASLLVFDFCRDPDDEKVPFFPTVKQMEATLLPSEVEVLVLAYKRLRTQAGPVIHNMDAEEMKKYINTLATSAEASPYFLDRFGWQEQVQLMIFMAQEVVRLQTLNSSAGSLSNNS